MTRRQTRYKTTTNIKLALALWAIVSILGCFLIAAMSYLIAGLV